MGKYSKIEWTHHTFNPWWGCVKVSAACKHCYAETWARRVGQDIWGKRAARRFFSNAHWEQPLRWNREALAERRRRRVFCASMGDVFEDRAELDQWRERLWGVIHATPQLDWLLLTKRPDRIGACVPWPNDEWPDNIWLGTTTETQAWADKRLPLIDRYAARVRFVSCEPLLGHLDLTPWLGKTLQWVIAGGESGAGARPSNPEWFRSLRDQCNREGVAFHFKQWGNWSPYEISDRKTRKVAPTQDGSLRRLNKTLSGRKLDGRTWDQLPKPQAPTN